MVLCRMSRIPRYGEGMGDGGWGGWWANHDSSERHSGLGRVWSAVLVFCLSSSVLLKYVLICYLYGLKFESSGSAGLSWFGECLVEIVGWSTRVEHGVRRTSCWFRACVVPK